jgi:hypothetical protein
MLGRRSVLLYLSSLSSLLELISRDLTQSSCGAQVYGNHRFHSLYPIPKDHGPVENKRLAPSRTTASDTASSTPSSPSLQPPQFLHHPSMSASFARHDDPPSSVPTRPRVSAGQFYLALKEINDPYQDAITGRDIDWAIFTYINDIKVRSTGYV